MRRFNALLTILIMILFVLHAAVESLALIGVGYIDSSFIARANFTLIGIHMLIGIKLSIDTLRACKKSGASYFRENWLFWTRRISGLAVMILLCFHMFAFGYTENGEYHLIPFDTVRLIAQLLLVISIALHVLTNIQPVLIAMGARNLKIYEGNILFVISLILLFFAVAFIIYFLQWQRF